MGQPSNPKHAIVPMLCLFVVLTGCVGSNSSTANLQEAAPATRQKAVVNLTELYVNDKRSEYKNATLNVDGIDLQFDHRCTMFGWYEFSCDFPKEMENERIANALQTAWDTQRIDGLPDVSFLENAVQCLDETTKTSLPAKKSIDCEQFGLSVNAFRAIDGSRNEIWLRFEPKKETQLK